MYNDRLYLTPQEILEKEFKIDARGYRPQEVDKFLDMVIRDYTEYSNIVRKLEKDIKDLTDENQELKQEVRDLKLSLQALKVDEKEVTNVDIIRRISQLEKIVLGKEQ